MRGRAVWTFLNISFYKESIHVLIDVEKTHKLPTTVITESAKIWRFGSLAIILNYDNYFV